MTPSQRPRLLLIGWDAADWDVIDPLIAAGRMPHLARLIRGGVRGNLASLRPCLTPMLWTTIATGAAADRHGILGFVEPLEDQSGIVPYRSTSRRAPALWNMLAAADRRSCVVTWPVSDPPEEIPGTYVSSAVLDSLADDPQGIQPPPPACFHPQSAAELCADWCFHPCELAPQDLADFIPRIGEIDLTRDFRPERLARHFARAVTTHSIATGLLERDEPWDLFAVYYETIDRVNHDFMAYRPPQMAGVPDADHEIYGGVVDAMHEFHDSMLGRLLELAGPDTCVAIVSDHGFDSGSGRPPYRPHTGPGVAEDGAESHRMMGMIVLHGPQVRKGTTIHGATLYDVLPTLLAWLGEPIGRDMPGKVLVQAFEKPPAAVMIRSWSERCPASPAPPVSGLDATRDHFASVRQFVALGYLPEEALAVETAVMTAVREFRYNLALVHVQHARAGEALMILDDLISASPDLPRYRLTRMECLRSLGRHRELLAEIEALGDLGHRSPSIDLVAIAARYDLGECEAARAQLVDMLAAAPADPTFLATAGQIAEKCGMQALAESTARSALALDPHSVAAHALLAEIAFQCGDFPAALDHATTGLQRYFFHPELHWIMARTLHAQGEIQRALVACNQVLLQAPKHPGARQAWLTWSAS